MAKVLLAEDDPAIAGPLARALTREGYEVLVSETGQGAIDLADSVDLMLLDLGLPDMDGLDVARRVRAAGLSVHIMVLTARAEEVDLVVGLDAGADDYVTKPFRLAELLARVRALLRRWDEDEVRETAATEARDIRIDTGSHRAFQGDKELRLTIKEYELLKILVENAGSVVLRDRLMNEIWGSDPLGSTKTLDMHISWIRRKLGDDVRSPKYITTVRGVGFRFEAGEE
ncbi:MAG: response regulator transcription factor [Cellulomonadaceae bacterium]|jgi:DNA-binding response OmpR family regulator|nr:response regulator transcription factor [Cellulomonadaceae bacterium]